MDVVKTDEYGEVINHEDTYRAISTYLNDGWSAIIGWTDQRMTHYDILFNLRTARIGSLQRGLKGNKLFVSIIGHGAFGFDMDNIERCGGYISEKLNIKGSEDEINELINGVIKALRKDKNARNSIRR